jgi:dTMP kinase
LDWCKSCDEGLIAPDCIIYLDMTVEDAAKRGNYGEERYEKEEFQRSVRARFMDLKARDTVPWFVLDATQSKESIHESISTISAEVVGKMTTDTPLTQLWGGLAAGPAASAAAPVP